jgi:rhodanese-related sulfurtransferase
MEGDALRAELAHVLAGKTRLALRSLRPGEGILVEAPRAAADSPFGELQVTDLPAGAVLLDCRSEAMRRWRPQWPDVQAAPLGVITADGYDKGVTYVAFCPQGQRSNAVAEKLREGGVRAYSFKGGEGALKSYLDACLTRSS